jgi:methyltransferase (TIGR00027 family)
MKPVSRTAFYCTGVRALDARKPKPACSDQFAERFMDDEAWRWFEPFRQFTGPNISNATRHRIIDDLLRERLAADPERQVVIIGAGFDSRAFRLRGGRWIEVDEPQVFAWKEPRLPAADCPNPLTRVPVDFETERLADRLRPHADPGRVTIIVEGVLFYLDEPRIRELLRTLRATFPHGEILCDVMTPEFFAKYGRAIFDKIRQMGASYIPPDRPFDQIFTDEDYVETTRVPTMPRALALGKVPWHWRLMVPLLSVLRDGYSIRAFKPR